MVLNIIGICAFLILVFLLIFLIIKSIKTQEIHEIGLPCPIWKGLNFKDYPSLFVLALSVYFCLLITLCLFGAHKLLFSFLFLNTFMCLFQFIFPTILLFTSKILYRKQGILTVYTRKEKPLYFYFNVILNYLLGIMLLIPLGILVFAFAVEHHLIKL